MPNIVVSKHTTASADAVWAMLADFGNMSWIPGGLDVRVEGSGPGMTRRIIGSSGDPIIETLLWAKPEERALSYEITNNPLPVTRFLAVVTVTPDGGPDSAAGAVLTWDVDYEPDRDDADARTAIAAVYGSIADWLADAAQTDDRTAQNIFTDYVQ
jgi:hypothetical protein